MAVSDAKPSLASRLDALQQNRRWLAFPLAVWRKHSQDDGGRHAALMTYYGFLSLIPLLLLAVVIVSRVLATNADLRNEVINNIVPEQFRASVDSAVQSLPQGGFALLVGVLGLIGSSLGVVATAHDTLNHVVGIPYRLRNSGPSRLIRQLATVAALLAAMGAVSSLGVWLGRSADHGPLSQIAQVVGLIGILFLLLWVACALLLPHPPRLRSIWPMTLIGSVVVAALIGFAALLLPMLTARSGAVYGAFAAIVGLLAFISLVAQALVWAAEIAVVKHLRLWPRSLDPERTTAADRVALGLLAREQERVDEQRVTSRVDPA